jgi:phage baseplate assembly protein W
MAAITRYPYGIILPIQRGDSGYFAQTYDIVEQTNYNLTTFLTTRKGERRGNPTFGSELYNHIFEFNNDELIPILDNVIRKDIQKWMPQVSINDIKIESTTADRDIYRVNISIAYTIPSLGVTKVQVVNISINQSNS